MLSEINVLLNRCIENMKHAEYEKIDAYKDKKKHLLMINTVTNTVEANEMNNTCVIFYNESI